jgi:hypothetical protein
MLVPDKYLDLRTCVLNIASSALLELMQYKVMSLNELSASIQTRLGEDARYNFLPALNFLFLVGKIDYDAKDDNIFLLSNGEK